MGIHWSKGKKPEFYGTEALEYYFMNCILHKGHYMMIIAQQDNSTDKASYYAIGSTLNKQTKQV